MTKAKKLTPEQLQEFRLRYSALNTARAQFLMVEEAFNTWVAETGKKLRVRGKLNIDIQTGEVTPQITEVQSA